MTRMINLDSNLNGIAARVVIALAALIGPGSAAAADELVLIEGVNGYEGVRDNAIYSESSSRSNGGGDHIFTGQTLDNDSRRALIRFDLADALPPGTVITGVELRLVVSRTRAFQPPLNVHKLLADWGEGTEDASGPEGTGTTATVGSATWRDNFYTQAAWTSPGGDFVATPSAEAIGGFSNNPVFWSSEQMVSDVQSWVDDPDSNFGWIVIGDESRLQTAVRFFSADNNEGSIESQWPRLTIQYEPGGGDLMGLTATELHRDQPATLTATEADPGARVYFLYSFAGPGSTFVPQLGIKLDLATPITNFANDVADAAGVATITRTVPANAPLRSISFQAVHLVSGSNARKSERVDTEILP